MISDLFEFSKLDMNRLTMDMQVVNSSVVFGEIANETMIELQNKGIDFRINGELPSASIRMDFKRIQQVISNLIENAVKYGASAIELLVEQQGRDLLVTVKDNGKGISAADLPYVFNLFYRGEKSRSREHGGVGLGLTISRSIIEAHQGEIWAASEEGSGSIFTFKLPLYLRM